MKIGGSKLGFVQTSTGARRDEMHPNVGRDSFATGAGYQDLAGSLDHVDAAFKAEQKKRQDEEEQRQRFAAMGAFSKFTGEMEIGLRDMTQNLPPDGAGALEGAGKLYNDASPGFLASIPEKLRPEYQARLDAYSTDMFSRTDAYAREAATTHAGIVISERINAAQTSVYDNPQLAPALALEIDQFIENAPANEAQKAEWRKTALSNVTLASIDGQVARGGKELFTPAGSAGLERLAMAVTQVESAGRADAESPAGAVGLMQILENDSPDSYKTGSEIARELKDPNFPFNGTEAERRAYLKDSKTNTRYGKYYLNKMLTRYGGDTELALIAYNGGMRRADEFVKAGRNSSVLPTETRQYVEKVYASMSKGPYAIPRAMNAMVATLDYSAQRKIYAALDAQMGAAQDEASKARREGVQTYAAGLDVPFKMLQKDIVRGKVTIETATDTIEKMLNDPANPMTEPEKDKARETLLEGAQGALMTKARIQEMLDDPSLKPFVDAFINSTDYDSLPVEKLAGMLEAAAQKQSVDNVRAQKDVEVQRTVNFEVLQLGLSSGDPKYSGQAGLDAIQAALADGTIRPSHLNEDLKKLKTAWETANADAVTRGKVVTNIAEGNPIDAGDASKLYSAADIKLLDSTQPNAEGVSREEFIAGSIVPFVAQTGVTPENVMTSLRRIADSPKWEDQKFAYRAMAQIQGVAQDRFRAQYGSEMANRVTAFVTLMDTMDEGKVAEYFQSLRDPQQASARAALQVQTEKELKDLSLNTVRGAFDSFLSGWFGVATASFAGQAGAVRLMADYHNVYTSVRPLYPSADKAAAATQEILQQTWGLDQNNKLMQYPPAKQYGAQDGDHLWVHDQFLRENNLPADGSVVLSMQPASTANEIARNGGKMEYTVTAVKPDGTSLVVNNWFADPEEAFANRNTTLKLMGLPVTAGAPVHRQLQTMLREYHGLQGKKLRPAVLAVKQSELRRDMDELIAGANEPERALLAKIFMPGGSNSDLFPYSGVPLIKRALSSPWGIQNVVRLPLLGSYSASAQLEHLLTITEDPATLDRLTNHLIAPPLAE